ncbi:Asp/Glu racemase [Alphaproteobacteria bacterium]|nr:Asp/Glu racemase [Alphaproteobacteria bacterium]
MSKSLETIPFNIENVIARRARMGLVALATDHVIEHELSRLVHPIEGIQIYTTRIPMEPEVTPKSLHGMKQLLTNAAKTLLPGVSFDVIAYGCTSASVIIGEKEIGEAIQIAHPDVAITTPITACLAALKTLNATRIGLLTPYVEAVNQPIREYFKKNEIEIVKSATFSEIDDNRAGMITPDSIKRAVLEVFSGLDLDLIFYILHKPPSSRTNPRVRNLVGSACNFQQSCISVAYA